MKGPYVLTWVSIVTHKRVVWRDVPGDEPVRFRSVAAAQAVFDKLCFSTSGVKDLVADMQVVPLVQWLVEQGQ